MADAKRCDICGTFYEGKECDNSVTIYYPGYGDWMDLCPHCKKELTEWMKKMGFKDE